MEKRVKKKVMQLKKYDKEKKKKMVMCMLVVVPRDPLEVRRKRKQEEHKADTMILTRVLKETTIVL